MWLSIIIAILGAVLTYLTTIQQILSNQWTWNLIHVLAVVTATMTLVNGVIGILSSAGVPIPAWLLKIVNDINGFLKELVNIQIRRAMARKAARISNAFLWMMLRTLVLLTLGLFVLCSVGCGVSLLTIAEGVVAADEEFLNIANGAWPVIGPQLPEPASEKIYTDACNTISALDTVLESAIAVGKDPLDFQNDMNQLNNAVVAIEALISDWESKSKTAMVYVQPADQAKVNRLKTALLRVKAKVAAAKK